MTNKPTSEEKFEQIMDAWIKVTKRKIHKELTTPQAEIAMMAVRDQLDAWADEAFAHDMEKEMRYDDE